MPHTIHLILNFTVHPIKIIYFLLTPITVIKPKTPSSHDQTHHCPKNPKPNPPLTQQQPTLTLLSSHNKHQNCCHQNLKWNPTTLALMTHPSHDDHHNNLDLRGGARKWGRGWRRENARMDGDDLPHQH